MLRARPPERLRRRPLGRYRYVRLRWRLLFAAVDLAGTAAFAAAGTLRAIASMLLPRRWSSARRPAADDPRTILLVQLDHLGDAVLSTAMLGPLRRRYPRASIEVLASEANREVFEGAAEVDRVHVSRVNRFARGRFGQLLSRRVGWTLATVWWGFRLARHKVDLAIDVRGDFPVAVILWLSGARQRLGWDCGGGGFLLTDRMEFVHGRPEIQSRLALLARLGMRPMMDSPVFQPSDSARHRAATVFGHTPEWLPTGARVAVHVGAGTPAKRWPAEHWRELTARLAGGHAASVVLVGSASDRAVAQSILGLNPVRGVIDWTGRLSVDELAAVLEASDLFVGADSGPAHLAAAVGTPAVVLFSGTNDPRQWQPCGRQVRVLKHPVPCSPCHRRRCPRTDHPCMRRLTPAAVAAAAYEMCPAIGRHEPTRTPGSYELHEESRR